MIFVRCSGMSYGEVVTKTYEVDVQKVRSEEACEDGASDEDIALDVAEDLFEDDFDLDDDQLTLEVVP